MNLSDWFGCTVAFWHDDRVELDKQTAGSSAVCLLWLFEGSSQFKCGSLTLEHSLKIYYSIFVCVCVWTSQTHTGGTGDGHNASLGLSQQRQEGLGDAQRAEEIDLHAPTVVGHQRQLDISEVHAHAGVIHQSPQTCQRQTNARQRLGNVVCWHRHMKALMLKQMACVPEDNKKANLIVTDMTGYI